MANYDTALMGRIANQVQANPQLLQEWLAPYNQWYGTAGTSYAVTPESILNARGGVDKATLYKVWAKNQMMQQHPEAFTPDQRSYTMNTNIATMQKETAGERARDAALQAKAAGVPAEQYQGAYKEAMKQANLAHSAAVSQAKVARREQRATTGTKGVAKARAAEMLARNPQTSMARDWENVQPVPSREQLMMRAQQNPNAQRYTPAGMQGRGYTRGSRGWEQFGQTQQQGPGQVPMGQGGGVGMYQVGPMPTPPPGPRPLAPDWLQPGGGTQQQPPAAYSMPYGPVVPDMAQPGMQGQALRPEPRPQYQNVPPNQYGLGYDATQYKGRPGMNAQAGIQQAIRRMGVSGARRNMPPRWQPFTRQF